MSYSTADEKYRKYAELLRSEPSNSLYKRKLQKYRTLASKTTQRGGNAPNPFAEPLSSSKDIVSSSRNNRNDHVDSRARTNELVSKIQNMLAYAQVAQTQTGAGKKKKHRTQTKGYRNMVGGVDLDFSADGTISNSAQVLQDAKHNQSADFGRFKEAQKQTSQQIVSGVEKLIAAKKEADTKVVRLEAELADLQGQLADVNRQMSDIEDQLAEKNGELVQLTTAKEQLEKALDVANTGSQQGMDQLRQQLEDLQQKAAAREEALAAEIAKLERQLAEATNKANGLDDDTAKLRAQIDAMKASANQLYTDLNTQHKVQMEENEQVVREYTEENENLRKLLKGVGLDLDLP